MKAIRDRGGRRAKRVQSNSRHGVKESSQIINLKASHKVEETRCWSRDLSSNNVSIQRRPAETVGCKQENTSIIHVAEWNGQEWRCHPDRTELSCLREQCLSSVLYPRNRHV